MALTSVANAVMMEGMGHGHTEDQIEHGTKDLENPCKHTGMQVSSLEGWILSDRDESDKEDCISHDTMFNCSMCTSIISELDVNLDFIGKPLTNYAFDVTKSPPKPLSELDRPPRA
ncbi:MAG: hypothetical protein WBM41_01435 [Arenicellales bacterium]